MTGRERGDSPVAPTAGPPDVVQQRFGDEANALRMQQAQRMAGDRRMAQPQPADFKTVTNSDGTVTVSFNDGTSVKVDNMKDKRPLEVVDKDKNVITFKYEKGGASYKMVDASGKTVEEGSKGEKDSEFKIKHFKDGKEVEGKDKHITEIKVTPDGHLDFIGKDGLHHERQRSGNQLMRDGTGRILNEQTPGNRITEYSYTGEDKQPSTFTVKDAKGNIVEHGVKGDKGWTTYKPGAGEATLDPKKLEDPAKAVNDPIDKVTDVQVNQKNGMRVETHANGDRTWGTDKHEYRMNPSGALVVLDNLPDGKHRLVSFRDQSGVKTSYTYDDSEKGKGMLTGETREYPDGKKLTLTREGDKDEWKNTDGKIVKAHADVLPDGSVQMTYPEGKFVLTQGASGVETVKRIDTDGKARVVHSTDTLGREYQFSYDSKTFDLTKMEITPPVSQLQNTPYLKSIVWERVGDENGQPKWQLGRNIDENVALTWYVSKLAGRAVSPAQADAWYRGNQNNQKQFDGWMQAETKPGGPKSTFVGSQEVLDDGSIMKTDAKTGERAKFSARGVKIDVPKEEKKPDEKKVEPPKPEDEDYGD